MKTNEAFGKILEALRVQTVIGGLEISDTALRFASFDGKQWKTTSLRLPPGIVRGDEVGDRAQFVEALKALRHQIVGPRSGEKVSAVVSLSSVHIYSQVFSLPVIEGENLDKAIQLNIQMVSPIEPKQTYSGWQLVGRDQQTLRLEILSAFINRSVADSVNRALLEAGFVAYALESRALSLARLVRELGAGFDPRQSYIILLVDGSGLEFVVIRSSQLYFQYFQSWRDLQGSERRITKAAFEAVLVRNLHQVLNFYNSHWSDSSPEIILSTSGLKEDILRAVQENFSLKTRELTLTLGGAMNSDWFVALGGGLRSLRPRSEDTDISLLGTSVQQEFRRHQAVTFVRFWRVLVPVLLSVLLLLFLGADVFLIESRRSLAEHPLRTVGDIQSKEMDDLQEKARAFNRAVALIGRAEQSRQVQVSLLEKIKRIMDGQSVALVRFYFEKPDVPATIVGQAKSEDDILSLKRALEEDGGFASVNLPLSDIRTVPQGLSFTMSFVIASSNAR